MKDETHDMQSVIIIIRPTGQHDHNSNNHQHQQKVSSKSRMNAANMAHRFGIPFCSAEFWNNNDQYLLSSKNLRLKHTI